MRWIAQWPGLLAGAALLAASTPAAATPLTVEIRWIATSSTHPASLASLGTADYVGAPGDVVTAALVLTVAEGTTISTYGVSMRFDAELEDQLDVLSVFSPFYVFIPEVSYPPVPDPSNPPTWLWPIHFYPEATESSTDQPGLVGTFSHQLFTNLPYGPFTVTVGHVNFVLTDALTTTGTLIEPGYWRLGIDSWIDGNLTNRGATGLTSYAGTVRALPEPGTAVSVAVGMLALLALRRRH